MFKVNNSNARTSYEICSKLTIKTPERSQWRRFGVFIVSFEHLVLVFLLFLRGWIIRKNQYSRRNYLLINGIKEGKDEVTDDIVVNMLQDKLEVEISKKSIDRSHRIGKPSLRKEKSIFAKFVKYNDCHKAYSNKK